LPANKVEAATDPRNLSAPWLRCHDRRAGLQELFLEEVCHETVTNLRNGRGLVIVAPAPARKWTSSSGEFSVEAELAESKGGNVRLKLKSGKIITDPLAKLSKADQDYLSALAKKRDRPKAKPAAPQPKERIAAIEKLGGEIVREEDTAPLPSQAQRRRSSPPADCPSPGDSAPCGSEQGTPARLSAENPAQRRSFARGTLP
jgi:hypothetical protein